MNKETDNLELIKSALKTVEKIKFSDGTEYFRMPNGNLVRASKRAFQIRKSSK
jgi:hypothetical protein